MTRAPHKPPLKTRAPATPAKKLGKLPTPKIGWTVRTPEETKALYEREIRAQKRGDRVATVAGIFGVLALIGCLGAVVLDDTPAEKRPTRTYEETQAEKFRQFAGETERKGQAVTKAYDTLLQTVAAYPALESQLEQLQPYLGDSYVLEAARNSYKELLASRDTTMQTAEKLLLVLRFGDAMQNLSYGMGDYASYYQRSGAFARTIFNMQYPDRVFQNDIRENFAAFANSLRSVLEEVDPRYKTNGFSTSLRFKLR